MISLVKGIKKNNQIFIIFLKGNGFWKKYYSKLGVKVINLSNFKGNLISFFKKIKYLVYFYKTYKINIVHAHLPHMEIYGFLSLLFSSRKIKFYITKHLDNNIIGGSNYKYHSIIASFINNIIFLKANKIIAISNSVKHFFLTDIFKVNSDKIKLIYYGINNDYLKLLRNKKHIYINIDSKIK